MTKISVIIPCFNRQDFIAATLDSVLAQSHPVDQVLVIDDGSSDNTVNIVQAYARQTGSPIQLIQQKNAGPSAARNLGLAHARSELIAFLDADDLWLPSKIERQVACLEAHPQAAGVYCRMFQFHAQLDDLGRRQPQNQMDDPSLEHLLLTMCIQSSTTLIRRSALEGLRFDESIRAAEDSLFFADIRLRGTWRMIDEPLTAYRVHGIQLTAGDQHALDTTLARVRWCGQREERLGKKESQRLQEALWRRLIQGMESRYWRRELAGLHAMREQLRVHCPQWLAQSFLNDCRIYPRWVYGLRDLIGNKPPSTSR